MYSIDQRASPPKPAASPYDGRDRPVEVDAASGDKSYRYDPLDNLRYSQRGNVTRHLQINPTIQRLGLITTVGSAATVDHAWNDRGELTTRTTATPSAPPAPIPPTIHKNGFEDALLVGGESFTFDRARRLTAAAGGTATYQYDAHHHRVVTTLNVPGWGPRYPVYSRAGDLLYIEDAGRNERTQFFHLAGTLVAERTRPIGNETATVNTLHSDHRGTPTVKTSSGGTRVYRSRLMPYGAPYDGIYRDGPGFTKHATDEIVSL